MLEIYECELDSVPEQLPQTCRELQMSAPRAAHRLLVRGDSISSSEFKWGHPRQSSLVANGRDEAKRTFCLRSQNRQV